jgi:iron complex outermembrane recepter protein
MDRLVDAALEWAVARNVSAALRGYNLTDETYVTSAYGDQQWILGRPRSAELAVKVGF